MAASSSSSRFYDEEDEEPSSKLTFRNELACSLKIAVPLALANLLERVTLWVTLALVGQHDGAAMLGPASLASSVNNVLGTSVQIGLSLAVQTLASQANGAGDPKALSLALQRALPIAVVFSVPVVTVLLTLGPILHALGRPADVCAAASYYALTILPVSALTGMQRAMTSWLASMQLARPLLWINIVIVPLHALLAFLLVYFTPLGYLGAGLSMSIQCALRCAITYAFISRSARTAGAWRGFHLKEAFSGWGSYLRIALPGVLFLAEFWVGEFLVFTATLLPQPEAGLSALAIYQLTNSTCYQPPSGLRIAVSSRVGNALGAGRPLAARRALRASLLLVTLWIGVPSVILLGFPEAWAHVFTDDTAVVDLLCRLVGWLVLYVGLDALLAVFAGALTGCGRQGLGGRLAILSYVAIGAPTALALAFQTPMATVGLAAGHTLGKLIMTIVTGIAIARTNWKGESDAAIKRVRRVLTQEPSGQQEAQAAAAPQPRPTPSVTELMNADENDGRRVSDTKEIGE